MVVKIIISVDFFANELPQVVGEKRVVKNIQTVTCLRAIREEKKTLVCVRATSTCECVSV